MLMLHNRLVLATYTLQSDKILNPVRIVHLSDLHEKCFGEGNSTLFNHIGALTPDLIAVTGDIIAHTNQKALDEQYITQLARGLRKISPVFFVTGNHEKMFLSDVLRLFLKEGVVFAEEKVSRLTIRGNRINICGMHDIAIEKDFKRNAAAFENIGEGYNIFLSHRPEHFKRLAHFNIDLLLCGHTHAGQIRFPLFGTFFMPGQGFFPKYLQGGFVNHNTTMIISRGLGSSGYPSIRINNPPEIVCIDLTNRRK